MSRRPPNLLFLYTDEQRRDTLACYGNRQIEMPNLNRLAEESTVFDRAYVSQPVCTPSRSTLLTGLWPHTNGCTENNVPLRPETKCFPEMLAPGYATAHHGKWHLGDEIFAQHGFQEWRGIDDHYEKYYSPSRDRHERCGYHHFLLSKGYTPANGSYFTRVEVSRFPESVSKPAYLAQEASRYFRENRDRPFVLFVNFFEPHMPFTGPRNAQYDPKSIPLPENFNLPESADLPLKTRLFQRWYTERGAGTGLTLKDEAGWQRLIAQYWGLCSQVDAHAGTILDALDANGLRDNTIVVWTSDHGDMMGSHRIVAKCTQYEEAVSVPMLIRMPGQRRGRRVTGPFGHIDVVPTLLDLMGQEVPSHLQGRSRRAQVEASGDARLTDDVVIEWNGANCGLTADVVGKADLPGNMPEWMKGFGTREEIQSAVSDPVRTIIGPEGWKYTCSTRGDDELYDLNADPFEKVNLARRPEQKARIAELRRRIGVWQKSTGDVVKLPG